MQRLYQKNGIPVIIAITNNYDIIFYIFADYNKKDLNNKKCPPIKSKKINKRTQKYIWDVKHVSDPL